MDFVKNIYSKIFSAKLVLAMILAVISINLFYVQDAHAVIGGVGGGGGTTGGAGGGAGSGLEHLEEVCGEGNQFKMEEGEDLKIVSVAVTCFENVMSGLAEKGMADFSNYLRNAVFAALMLYLIFFGAKVSTGVINEQKVKGEFFIHALKVAFVGWLIFQLGILDLWRLVGQVYDGLIEIVLLPAEVGDCPLNEATTDAVWETMDCILSKFLGWNVENGYGEEWEGTPLLFGFVAHSASSGFTGILMGLIVTSTIWGLVMSFFRVAFVYVLSILGLVILFVIAPLIIPTILFPQTKNLFDGWMKLIVSFILQPVILFAFLSFVIVIMYEIVGDPSNEDSLLGIYKEAKPGYESAAAPPLPGNRSMVVSMFDMMKDAQNLDVQTGLTFSLISLLVTAYLLLSFTNFVAAMGHELAGQPIAPNLSGMAPKWLNSG